MPLLWPLCQRQPTTGHPKRVAPQRPSPGRASLPVLTARSRIFTTTPHAGARAIFSPCLRRGTADMDKLS
jgi:hypothetical protein